MFRHISLGICAAALLSVATVGGAAAQSNIRGATTGPTTAPGFFYF